MIMDGNTFNIGAVAGLRRIKNAIGTARHVMDHTSHTLLVGDQATEFAKSIGFVEESLQTPESKSKWIAWRANKCQPNYWVSTFPPQNRSCGPYKPIRQREFQHTIPNVDGHDTIGIVVIDNQGHIASGTSTNGKMFKIPGRVGDSPIPGAGSYADHTAGGCAATGDGDIMLRFLPCYNVVEQMRNGIHPKEACENALKRIVKYYPGFRGAVIAANMKGEHGAANCGQEFSYGVRNANTGKSILVPVKSCNN